MPYRDLRAIFRRQRVAPGERLQGLRRGSTDYLDLGFRVRCHSQGPSSIQLFDAEGKLTFDITH